MTKRLEQLRLEELREFIRRLHGIHWRLRFRSKATETELEEWRRIRSELRDMIPPTTDGDSKD